MTIMGYIRHNILRRVLQLLPTPSQLLEKLFMFVVLQAMLVSVLCMPHLEITEHTIPTGFFSSVKRRYCNIEIYVDQHIWMKSVGYTLLVLSECKGRLHFLSLCVYGIVFARNWWANVCGSWDFFARYDYGANVINARPLAIILFTYFVLQVVFTVTLFVQNLCFAMLGCNEFLDARLIGEQQRLLDNFAIEQGHAIGDSVQWRDDTGDEALTVERLLDAIVLSPDDMEDAGDEYNDGRLVYADDDEYFVVIGAEHGAAAIGANPAAHPMLNLFNTDANNNHNNNNNTLRELGAGDCL